MPKYTTVDRAGILHFVAGDKTLCGQPDPSLDAPYRVVCGTFHPDPETNNRCNAQGGFPANTYDDTGCGHFILWTFAYRCLDCGRWFHATCLRNHFKANIEPPY